MKEELNKKSNKDLLEYQLRLKEDYEVVRKQLLQLYDELELKKKHWGSIENEYNRVLNELNLRYGIKKTN